MTNSQKSTTISGADIFHTVLKRQKSILADVPTYFRIIFIISAVGFLLSISLNGFGELLVEKTLSGIISVILSIFTGLLTWVFILWGLTFIPFVIYKSYQASTKFSSYFGSRPFRWIQLLLPTSLSTAFFVIAYAANPVYKSSNSIPALQVKSTQDLVVLLVGSVTTALLLSLIFSSKLNLHLKLGSFNLLFITVVYYQFSYSAFFHSLLFGILFYLMFASGQIETIGRQIVIYDFDAKIISDISKVWKHQEELNIAKDEILLAEKEIEQRRSEQASEILKMKTQLAKNREKYRDEIVHMETDLEERKEEQQSEIQIMEMEINGKSREHTAEIRLAEAQLSNLMIKRQQLENSLSKIKYPSFKQDEIKNEMDLETIESDLQTSTQPHSKIHEVVSILFLAADPTNASRLRLGEEFREINKQLRLAQLRDQFTMELPQLSIRPQDITQALLETHPQIVHFSGHGTSSGELCFENEAGESFYVPPEALTSLFKQFQKQIQCVILNACYSQIQANAIAAYIKYVIGMTDAIDDKAAIAFSIGFYQALGAGKTIEESYQFGCVQILLQGIPGDKIPALIQKENLLT